MVIRLKSNYFTDCILFACILFPNITLKVKELTEGMERIVLEPSLRSSGKFSDWKLGKLPNQVFLTNTGSLRDLSGPGHKVLKEGHLTRSVNRAFDSYLRVMSSCWV